MSGDDQLTMTNEELGLEPEIEVEVEHDDAPPAREIKPEEGIEELKAKLLAEQRAREEIEQQAIHATRAASYAFHEKEESDVALVQSALQQVDEQTKQMKAAYAAAARAGEFDKMADLAMDMQAMMQNRQQLEQGLEVLNDRIQQARQPRRPPPQQPMPRTQDPVEAVASRLTPASAKWVRDHPEYATDDAKRNKMVAAHYEAVSENLKADSREYFDFIEQRLGVENEPAPRQSVPRAPALRSPPPAAPARGSGGQANKRVVTLSAAQREIAKMSGQTDEEYAQQLEKLRAEGRITGSKPN